MSKITIQTYNKIKEKYGNISSWALWSEQSNMKSKLGMGDISFFETPTEITLNLLNPNIILVGLNISEKIERVFGNFHPDKTSGQDYKTRFALHGTMFWGGYMTDIIKSYEEKISGNLMKYLSKNKEFEKENIKAFEQELIDIGSQDTIIIAFGNDSYNILKRNLKDKYKIYKVPHYSAFIQLDALRLAFTELENTITSASHKYPSRHQHLPWHYEAPLASLRMLPRTTPSA
jgi:hypothetical protein